jgi:hypothetical protein
MASMSEEAARRLMSTDCSACGTSFADCDALGGRRRCCRDCALSRRRIHEPGASIRRSTPQYTGQTSGRRGVDLVVIIRVVAATILLLLVALWLFR